MSQRFLTTLATFLVLFFGVLGEVHAQAGMPDHIRASSATTVQGTIVSLKKSSLTVTVRGIRYVVTVEKTTKYTDRTGKSSLFSALKVGHTVKVQGKKNTAKKTIVKVTKIVDQTLPKTVVTSPTTSVTISGFAFSPASLSVTKGTKVTWTNNDAASHTVTGSTGPSSGTLSAGSTYSYTFDTAGTFSYHCAFHSGMTGTVTVTVTE